MTTEELLRDYIRYHYVEGNITNEQRVKMEFAAANYLQELKQLHIPVVVRQSEQLVCEYCNEDAKPTCCDSCLESMVNAVQKAN